MRTHNERAVNTFNIFCNAILTQYDLMTKQKTKVGICMEKAKRTFF